MARADTRNSDPQEARCTLTGSRGTWEDAAEWMLPPSTGEGDAAAPTWVRAPPPAPLSLRRPVHCPLGQLTGWDPNGPPSTPRRPCLRPRQGGW